MARPTAAIVGRPNVGKSTLFNRLVGERVAIVEDLPGTTRDRLYGTVEWRGREFSLIDTGGIEDPQESRGRARPGREPTGSGQLEAAVRRQVDLAIEQADVVLFLVDAKAGVVPVEHEVADKLRRAGKPTLLVANKVDGWRGEAQSAEFYELGLGDPITVSAIQGLGTGDLLDVVVERLPEDTGEEVAADARIAIIGRPNVGKSSFLNALVGEERVVVGDLPGTTRDTVDTLLERDGKRILLIDTAGIRRRGRTLDGIEKYALLRTQRALERADVAIMLTDATEGLTAQDTHIAGYAIEAGVGMVIALNKWDLVERGEDNTERVQQELAREFHFAPWLGHRFVSAKSGRNVDTTFADAVAIAERRRQHIPTPQLQAMLMDVLASHPPPTRRGRSVRFLHVTQAETHTPTFIFYVDHPDAVHFSYRRYLENKIRERFGFEGTPIRLGLRS